MKLHTRRFGWCIRAVTAMAAVGLGAWCGSGIAQADTNHERQACALLDDYASTMRMGYLEGSYQYAFAVLSKEMPPEDAAHALAAAVRTECPNHAGDLPPGWQ